MIIFDLKKIILFLILFVYSQVIMAAPGIKIEYNSDLSVIDFYLLRVYEKIRCENSFDQHSIYYDWCLQDVPFLKNNKIEIHFILKEKSHLIKRLKKAPSLIKQNILCRELKKINYWYRSPVNLYFGVKKSPEQFSEEIRLEKFIVIYIHYKEKKEELNYKAKKGEMNCLKI